jgi:hypothetical protein
MSKTLTRRDFLKIAGAAVTAGLAVIIGAITALIGVYWDDAWHTDIGRDSFWSPPDMAFCLLWNYFNLRSAERPATLSCYCTMDNRRPMG